MAATKNQSAYEQLLKDFDAAQSGYERAKTQEVTAKHQTKTASKNTKSKTELAILQLQLDRAKYRRKSRKAALEIAKLSIKLWLKNNVAPESAPEAPVVEVAAEPVKKRRGRQPKPKPEAVVEVAAIEPTDVAPKRRGRPRIFVDSSASREVEPVADEVEAKAGAYAGVMEEPAVVVAEERAVAAAPAAKVTRQRRSSEEVAASKVAYKTDLKGDDFTIIEGIGLKVMSFLHDNGYLSFNDIADANVDDMRALLKSARNNIANPTTWGEQARLAAERRYDELETLKASIKYGKKA